MKKALFFAAFAISLVAVEAQINPNCVGWKNPANFTQTGTHQELWTGYTGNKNNYLSTCTSEGATYTTVVQAANLEAVNNTSGCNITLYQDPNVYTNSIDIHNQSDGTRQFVIKGAGYDPETMNHLSYLPPDTSFHSSIRLGNYCGNHGAEKLTYEFVVMPENAMVTLWYALSMQNGQHLYSENNPEFTIVVQKNLGTATNPNWVPLAGDTLCLMRTSPGVPFSAANGDTAFYSGSTGAQLTSHSSATYGHNIYLPWHKLLIDLSNNTYQKVRIKITAGDCSMSAHYALAYIAGDCQPSELMSKGCYAGENNVEAPKGATVYEWYRSNTGVLSGNAMYNDNNYQQFAVDSTGSVDMDTSLFVNTTTGAALSMTTVMCKIKSYMNPNIPRVVKVYTNAYRPIVAQYYDVACESYTWNDSTYSISGEYIQMAPSMYTGNCDSTLILHLTINTPVENELNETVCDDYTWGEETYTVSGDYERTLPAVNYGDCDTTETLHLIVNYSVDTAIADSVVGSYEWNGETYTESGTYTWTGVTAEGCDSTVTLTLVVTPLGIENVQNTEFGIQIYPNPTSGWLNIAGDDVLGIELFDLAGHKIAEYKSVDRIYIGSLPSASYVVRTTCRNGVATHRITLK